MTRYRRTACIIRECLRRRKFTGNTQPAKQSRAITATVIAIGCIFLPIAAWHAEKVVLSGRSPEAIITRRLIPIPSSFLSPFGLSSRRGRFDLAVGGEGESAHRSRRESPTDRSKLPSKSARALWWWAKVRAKGREAKFFVNDRYRGPDYRYALHYGLWAQLPPRRARWIIRSRRCKVHYTCEHMRRVAPHGARLYCNVHIYARLGNESLTGMSLSVRSLATRAEDISQVRSRSAVARW